MYGTQLFKNIEGIKQFYFITIIDMFIRKVLLILIYLTQLRYYIFELQRQCCLPTKLLLRPIFPVYKQGPVLNPTLPGMNYDHEVQS